MGSQSTVAGSIDRAIHLIGLYSFALTFSQRIVADPWKRNPKRFKEQFGDLKSDDLSKIRPDALFGAKK